MLVFGQTNADNGPPRELKCETNTDALMLIGALEMYFSLNSDQYNVVEAEQIEDNLQGIREITNSKKERE